MERAIDVFRMASLPAIEELPGFSSASLMVDRASGRAVVSVTYDNLEAMQQNRDEAAAVRTAQAKEAGLEVLDVHGVRLFSDLVPSALLDSEADRAALLDLEHAASRHPDFGFLGQLGAAVHLLARR
jgi:hypothetical protein